MTGYCQWDDLKSHLRAYRISSGPNAWYGKTATGKLGNGKKGNQIIAYWMNE